MILLSCRKGILVILKHNEIQDATGDLAFLVWGVVKHELVVREAYTKIGTPALNADLAIWGVCLPQTEVLFDVSAIETDTQSYSDRTPREVLRVAECERKTKFMAACEKYTCSVYTNLLLHRWYVW